MKVIVFLLFFATLCIGAGLLLLTVRPAHAEIYKLAAMFCDDTDSVRNHLMLKYKEQVVGTSGDSVMGVVEVFKGKETWTIVSSLNNVSCILAAGKNWTVVVPGDPT